MSKVEKNSLFEGKEIPDLALELSEHDSRSRWLERGPNEFPSPWASEWGFDEYGLWQTFMVRDESGRDISHKMRFIPKGEFIMGSADNELDRRSDENQHQVQLTEGYWLGETTVTQALWQVVMENNPSEFQGDRNSLNFNEHELPVERINWHDSQKFCQTLSERVNGLSLTLPSEAQWEYACRGGTYSAYHVGEYINEKDANHLKINNQTMPAKYYAPNAWGLYQMHGNVFEWCQDEYKNYNDEAETQTSNLIFLRGGSWLDHFRYCRSASRASAPDNVRSDINGLRVIQPDPPKSK